jgi:HAD superfamily 5'-nucleotidase-like hydrolase
MIFVNRILNLKHIKAIGFDMDHTLVRYHIEEFEQLSYQMAIEKLVKNLNYPQVINSLEFDPQWAIRGLVIDCTGGNILKLNQFNRVKSGTHGLTKLDYREIKELYRGQVIDLYDKRYMSIDTSFSMAFCCLFAQLVDLSDKSQLPEELTYEQMATDCQAMIDLAHRDGTLKGVVRKNPKKFVYLDESVPRFLEDFARQGKTLFVVTNSDYSYTKLLLDTTLTPFLKEYQCWSELFQVVITQSAKPRFFTDRLPFLKVHPGTGLLENYEGDISRGIFQGGGALQLQEGLGLEGDEILYIGDHIYGDILKLKKSCQWRTALVIEELAQERENLKMAAPIQVEIDQLMQEKEKLEKVFFDSKSQSDFQKIEKVDQGLRKLILEYNKKFNPYWGETFRAGQDPSLLAWQMERFACIYMNQISDLGLYSPQHYFRPQRRPLPHELPIQ